MSALLHDLREILSQYWVLIVAGIVAAALVVAFWVTVSHFEAVAYENITGRAVSTWDAMWLQLRVDG